MTYSTQTENEGQQTAQALAGVDLKNLRRDLKELMLLGWTSVNLTELNALDRQSIYRSYRILDEFLLELHQERMQVKSALSK